MLDFHSINGMIKMMTEEERSKITNEITEQRDALQRQMDDARELRMNFQLQNREKRITFLQKIGELSFAFGGAIVPAIMFVGQGDRVKYPIYVLTGVGLYLMSGVTAFWRVKTLLDQDGDDAPHIGLDEEILTYPIIYANTKLLWDPDKKEYWNERVTAEGLLRESSGTQEKTGGRIEWWSDALLFIFVLASLLIARSLWPYSTLIYLCLVGTVMLFFVGFGITGYVRSLKSMHKLQAKRDKLSTIRRDFEHWHNG